MNIGSLSSHKSPKVYFGVLRTSSRRSSRRGARDGRGRQVSCRGHVSGIFYTSYARDMGSVQSVVRYRDIGWPTFDGRHACRPARERPTFLTSSAGFSTVPRPSRPRPYNRQKEGNSSHEISSTGCDLGSVGSHDLLAQGSVHWTFRRHWSCRRRPSCHTWS